MVNNAGPNDLLMMTLKEIKQSVTIKIIVIANSFGGNDWQSSASMYATEIFRDNEIMSYASGCQLNLPDISDDLRYELEHRSYTLSQRDELARFLESATFGVTTADLDELEAATVYSTVLDAISSYVEMQQDAHVVPPSSHREVWREKLNARVSGISTCCCCDYFHFKQTKITFV